MLTAQVLATVFLFYCQSAPRAVMSPTLRSCIFNIVVFKMVVCGFCSRKPCSCKRASLLLGGETPLHPSLREAFILKAPSGGEWVFWHISAGGNQRELQGLAIPKAECGIHCFILEELIQIQMLWNMVELWFFMFLDFGFLVLLFLWNNYNL